MEETQLAGPEGNRHFEAIWTDGADRWQCELCQQVVEVERDDYPAVGTPYCANCDREMFPAE